MDVRMRGFTERTRVKEARQWVRDQSRALESEMAPLGNAAGRVLATQIKSAFDVPGFRRSMMDGYAILADDSAGASTYNAWPLDVIGESMPGDPAERTVVQGTAVRIMTGAPMPAGADAVLPAEKVRVEGERVLMLEPVSPGKNVAEPGEDIRCGASVLPEGRWLRPQDIGVLSSIGVGQVAVVRRPRVRIVVTGNELLPPGSAPVGVRIVDSNSPMLAALIQRDGGQVQNPGILPDSPSAIREALYADADVVLVSGGSSVGKEDYAPVLLQSEGQLAIHGVAMRPSSPAGMGRLEHRLVFLLPGNPVSCLAAYDFFAGPAIRRLGGLAWPWPYPVKTAPLARKIVSVVGRVDYARVRFEEDRVVPIAISGASMLSSTTRADGFVIVPEDSEGHPEQASVDVHMYDTNSIGVAGDVV